MADDLSSVIMGEPERLTTGFEFTEGPLWHPDGYLLFVDIRKSQLLKWTPGQRYRTVRENTNEGNGLTLDLQGRLIMCEMSARRLTRTESDGTITVLADTFQGKRLNRINDVICMSDGSICFTDPNTRLAPEDRELDFAGVFRLYPDGTLSLLTTDCEYPNGLALSPEEKVLYVANSRERKYIRAFDVQSDGSLANSRVFADLSSPEEEVPDGMKVDAEGRVFCTGPGGTWIFNPQGDLIGVLRTDEVPANCAFGGSDYRTLFLTARTSVYTVRVRTPGAKPPWA